jgi:hypothetical protein
MFNEFDRRISEWSESAARMINRRKVMRQGVKGLCATFSGLAIASVLNVKSAFADGCSCSWIGGPSNQNCPNSTGCPSGGGCPAGYTICTTGNDSGHGCVYQNGSWVAYCSPSLPQGQYRLCTDCKYVDPCRGYYWYCTCLSGVLTGNPPGATELSHRVAESEKNAVVPQC